MQLSLVRVILASLLFLQAVHVFFLFPPALLGRDLQEKCKAPITHLREAITKRRIRTQEWIREATSDLSCKIMSPLLVVFRVVNQSYQLLPSNLSIISVFNLCMLAYE